MFSVSLGAYSARITPLHALDPRTKLLSLVLLMLCTFVTSHGIELVLMTLVAGLVLSSARVGFRYLQSILRPFTLLFVSLALVNLFFVTGGTLLFDIGWLRISTTSLFAGILYPVRLMIALSIASLFTRTTSPTRLSDALEKLLAPLDTLGLPGRDIALMFSLMMRFVPLIAQETHALVEAYALKGLRFDRGSLGSRLKAIVPLLISLVAGTLRHAQHLGQALTVRCWRLKPYRTHMSELKYQPKDWYTMAGMILFTALFLIQHALCY